MKVTVLGGSGFIGAVLVRRLAARGDEVFVPTRNSNGRVNKDASVCFVAWDGLDSKALVSILEGSDAVINLIGENISGQRWSPVVKKRILESRLRAGNALVTACRVLEKNRKCASRLRPQDIMVHGRMWRARLCVEKICLQEHPFLLRLHGAGKILRQLWKIWACGVVLFEQHRFLALGVGC